MPTLVSFTRTLAFISLLGTSATAGPVFRSGPAPVALIELYTSEGCSSCPPAEKWLAGLRDAPGLWKEFVPVAFHVSYWDHLGWRDVLASKAFTERQHAYAEVWRASSVYTPGFVRNGTEWRPRDAMSVAVKGAADAGVLTLRWDDAGNRCTIDYAAATGGKAKPGAGGFEVSVALLGSGIVHQVRKGENAGRELRHEFVALRLETRALEPGNAGAWSAVVSLPPRTDLQVPRRALAAWITPRGQLTPLQATGGWLDEK